MMNRKGIIAGFLAVLLGLIAVGVVSAQQPQPTPSDDQVNAIAKQLYCPVCENIPLDVCPTTACAQWRELIRQKLADGWTEPQIKAYFVQQYGDRVLGTPPTKGINWLVYFVPPIAIIAGIYILYRVLKSYRRQPVTVSSPPPDSQPGGEANAVQDEYIKRLEEEVKKG